MSRTPDVCWAGPLVRAEANLRNVGELLERRQRAEAMDLLTEVQRDIALAAEFVMREEATR